MPPKVLARLFLTLILFGNAYGIEVSVIPLDGKDLGFSVRPSDKIDDLKTKIENSQDIEVDDQRLYFENQLLDNFNSLTQYQMKNFSGGPGKCDIQ
jgi:hypothetical protein